MSAGHIRIRGARTHNLADVDLDLPRAAWTAVVGRSGSGKSSLVMDTLVVESRRRYLGTLRHAARGIDLAPRPDVDAIEGLPPAVASGFQPETPGPRETLATVAELARPLRVLFARLGTPHCTQCDAPLLAADPATIRATLLALPPSTRLLLVAPQRRRGVEGLRDAAARGIVRVRLEDGRIERLEDLAENSIDAGARVDFVVDRLVVKPDARDRFASSIGETLQWGQGRIEVVVLDEASPRVLAFATHPHCAACDLDHPVPTPARLSFDHPEGACPTCSGKGAISIVDRTSALPDSLVYRRLRTRLGTLFPRPLRRSLADLLEAWRGEVGLARGATLGEAGAAALERLWSRPFASDALGPAIVEAARTTDNTDRLGRSVECPDCLGARMAPFGRRVRWLGTTLPALETASLDEVAQRLANAPLEGALGALLAPVAADARERLAFLLDLGLGYLSLGRAARTLSQGELRRTELAATCAARMSGLLFVLDEPTAGLHPLERAALARRLAAIVAEGNTLVVVDHDPLLFQAADFVVVVGPGAGREGGRIVAAGPRREVELAGSAGDLLPRAGALGPLPPPAPNGLQKQSAAGQLEVLGARARNLRGIDASFPLGALSVIAGPSGAGKSTLLVEVLGRAMQHALAGRQPDAPLPADVLLDGLRGAAAFDRVVLSGGRPGRSPRATAGSLLGVLPAMRGLYARTLEARARGWHASWFGTHAKGGRCEACAGLGERLLRLPEAPAFHVPCDVCGGSRFREEAQAVRWRGRSIAETLAATLAENADAFRDVPGLGEALAAAVRVGLGYVVLGEPTDRLSRGEALRLSLSRALGRVSHARTLFLLDEPSIGLHPLDVERIVVLFEELAAVGHAVIVVEHQPRVLAAASHIVELGPGPGVAGGRVVFAGPPHALARSDTASGRVLREALGS